MEGNFLVQKSSLLKCHHQQNKDHGAAEPWWSCCWVDCGGWCSCCHGCLISAALSNSRCISTNLIMWQYHQSTWVLAVATYIFQQLWELVGLHQWWHLAVMACCSLLHNKETCVTIVLDFSANRKNINQCNDIITPHQSASQDHWVLLHHSVVASLQCHPCNSTAGFLHC